MTINNGSITAVAKGTQAFDKVYHANDLVFERYLEVGAKAFNDQNFILSTQHPTATYSGSNNSSGNLYASPITLLKKVPNGVVISFSANEAQWQYADQIEKGSWYKGSTISKSKSAIKVPNGGSKSAHLALGMTYSGADVTFSLDGQVLTAGVNAYVGDQNNGTIYPIIASIVAY